MGIPGKAAWCRESREPGSSAAEAAETGVLPLRAAVFLTSKQAYKVLPYTWQHLGHPCFVIVCFPSCPCRIVLVKFIRVGYQKPAGAIKRTFTDLMLMIHRGKLAGTKASLYKMEGGFGSFVFWGVFGDYF